MIFIFGGMYQGKREFARNKLGITEDMICGPEEIRMWIEANLSELAGEADAGETELIEAEFAEVGTGATAPEEACTGVTASAEAEPVAGCLDALIESLRDKTVIMNDISQGLVPMDPRDRAVREANGRLMIRLAGEADSVYRVFCGIGEKVK